MKLRERIIYKGLLLISVPLVAGMLLVAVLTGLLTQAGNEIKHELRIKEAMALTDRLARAEMVASSCAISFDASGDKTFRGTYDQKNKQIAELYRQLSDLLAVEPAYREKLSALKVDIARRQQQNTLIIEKQVLPDRQGQKNRYLQEMDLVGNRTSRENLPTALLFSELQRTAARADAATFATMSAIQLALAWGVIVSFVISLALSIFFSRNINCRLLNILINTERLSAGKALNPPLKGTDEIAELDSLLYKTALQIEEHERFRQALVGVVSHELKTPLTSVNAIITGLASGIFGSLAEHAMTRAERAAKNLERLMALIRDFLSRERREAGNLQISLKATSINEVLTTALEAVQDQNDQYSVGLQTDRTREIMVGADREHLVHAVVNLICHAGRSGCHPAAAARVETFLKDGWVEVRISPVSRAEPVRSADSQRLTADGTGSQETEALTATGLDLAISRSIIEQHGGALGVDESDSGESTFWFRIPGPSLRDPDQATAVSLGRVSLRAIPAVQRRKKAKKVVQLKIWHRGMILIAVPLLFELGFVAVLSSLFNETSIVVHWQEQSQEVIITANRLMNKQVEADIQVGYYLLTHSANYLKEWERSRKEALHLYKHLQVLTAGDAVQQANVQQYGNFLFSSFAACARALNVQEPDLDKMWKQACVSRGTRAYVGKAQNPADELLSRETQSGEKHARRRQKMSNEIELVLGVGITLNLLVSLSLAVYLMRCITGRLRHVMINTRHLAARKQLSTPLQGSDELAYLDQFFFQTARHLRELEERKHELISVVSDELRLPLSSVQATIKDLLSGALGTLSEKAQKRLNVAEKEVDRLVRLINELLDIKKMEAGKFDLKLTDVAVSELLQSSLAAVAQLAETNKVRLAVESDSADLINVDRDRITQVVINLLSNAIKFSPAGGIVRLVATRSESRLELQVIDQGRGIPAHLQERIFDRFFQVSEEDASVKGGSGLGLSIVKSIVEQHGGSIWVDSEEGCGSTFWVSLPLRTLVEPA
jgi:signal transduction histidine kinase